MTRLTPFAQRAEALKKALEGFPTDAEERENNRCNWCSRPVNPRHFTSAEAFTKYRNDGVCQSCQDKLENAK